MARSAAIRKTESSLAPEFERKIRDARYLVGEDRFIVTFDSGKEYTFSRSALEVDDGSDLVKIQIDRRRFFFRVTQVSGNRYEVPWDRVLHETEPSYSYFRGRTIRSKTSGHIGARIRKLRGKRIHSGGTRGCSRNDAQQHLSDRSGKASPHLRDVGKNRASTQRFSRGTDCAALILQRAELSLSQKRKSVKTRHSFSLPNG